MADIKPGDWICPNETCKNHNFAKRQICRRCNTTRPDGDDYVPQDGERGRVQPVKPGDWICSYPSCGSHNFARRTTCRGCEQPRPVDDEQPGSASRAHGLVSATELKPGDWMCPCGAHNFARRRDCHQCTSPKQDTVHQPQVPRAASDEQFKQRNTGPRGQGTAGAAPVLKPGDWMCQCGAHNFARRAECHRCKDPNPSGR